MKKSIVLTIILTLFFSVSVQAEDGRQFVKPLTEAYIKYERLNWQDYEFWVISDLPEDDLNYEWSINDQEIYNTQKVRSFLPRGENVIKVKVEDKYGNVLYDTVRLDIRFWSLQNNWFWWLLYLLVVLIILYYWVVKIVYLFNRRKVSKDVRAFLDILDEHGWVEKIIAKHCKEKKIPRRSKGDEIKKKTKK